MNFSLKDLPALGKPLLVFAAVLAIGIAVVMFSQRMVRQASLDLAAAQKQLEEARKRVQQSGSERDTIMRYIAPYQRLVQHGVIGSEQRLSWIDALRAANAQVQLYGVEYEVGTQQPYAFAAEAQGGNVAIQQSVMKLKFGILYEEDLLGFFRALQSQDVGAFSVNQCSLTRIPGAATKPANAPTLKAECDVAWITIPAPMPEEKS